MLQTRPPPAPGAFLYMATDPAGARRFGLCSAGTERAVADHLRRDRLLLLRAWRVPAWAVAPRGLSLRDQAAFNDALGQLLTRGVPLVEALDVASQASPPRTRPRLDRLRELVAAGSSFADACLRVGGFDAVTAAVYRAAERTGDLGGAAKHLAATFRRRLAISGKAATLLMYPAIVLSVSLLVSTGLIMFIVPRIGSALKQTGAELPWFTLALVAVGTFLRDRWVLLLLTVLAVAAAVVVLRRQVGRVLWTVVRRLPLMRDLILAQELARFFSVMAAMTRSGVTLADALGVAIGSIGHPSLRAQLASVRTRLVEGAPLPTLIDGVAAMPLATRRLLVAAERSGELDPAFEMLAADAADDVDRRAARLLAALEPALIVLMFLMIGSLVLAIMVPMLTAAGAQVGGR